MSTIRAVVAMALLAACSSSSSPPPPPPSDNRPPVLDGIEAPDELAPNTDGIYKVQFKVTFHDDDHDAITKIRVRVESADVTGIIDDPNADAYAALGNFEFKGMPAKTAYPMQMSVFDARGAESAVRVHTITLK